jgi:hypothetical protein
MDRAGVLQLWLPESLCFLKTLPGVRGVGVAGPFDSRRGCRGFMAHCPEPASMDPAGRNLDGHDGYRRDGSIDLVAAR